MEPATWANCRADFAFDGAWVDLIVPGADTLTHWETGWAALRGGPFALQAFRDSEPIPLPGSAAEIFDARERDSIMVSVRVGTLTANCHFVGGDLELDIDPREVADPTSFEAVLTLMRFMAATIGLPMIAVAEGGTPAFAFLSVSPEGQATYLPAGSIGISEPTRPD